MNRILGVNLSADTVFLSSDPEIRPQHTEDYRPSAKLAAIVAAAEIEEAEAARAEARRTPDRSWRWLIGIAAVLALAVCAWLTIR